MRKVRVLCAADPFATDSSSDDDEEGLSFPFPGKKNRASNSTGKVFVREILVPVPTSDQVELSSLEAPPPASSSSREEDEAPNQCCRSVDLTKRREGVVGPYNTQEDAVNAYDGKNQSLMKTTTRGISDIERGEQTMKTKSLTSIYSTSLDSLVLRKKYPGVRQRKNGRWQASVYRTGYIGTFDTAEEAADACARVRMERDPKKRKHLVIHCKKASKNLAEGKAMGEFRRPSSSSSNYFNYYKLRDDVVPNSDSLYTLLMKKKYPGVTQASSGRWTTKIKLGKYSTRHLGTFDTPEEAADAFNRARMKRDSKKRKREIDISKSMTKGKGMKSKSFSENDSELSTSGTDKDHMREAEKPSCLLEKCDELSPMTQGEPQQGCKFRNKSSHVVSPDLTCEAESSGATAEGSNEREDNHTGFVSDYAMPDFLLANGNVEDPCLEILNSYGQLIGEYSKLDDQLWLCRHEEDDDDDENYGSCGYASMVFSEDVVCDYKPAQLS